jgi:peptidoglycan/LPS O-acetylase OafA/YrhL
MERIQSLDGWRAVAIGLVILAHLAGCAEIRAVLHPQVVAFLGGYGVLGVQVFFVISGYVIARGLLADEREGGISLRGFYMRRACRILPPLAIFLAALAAMGIAANFAPAALFLCNTTVLGECEPIIGHTWSLAFEEQFYLLLPAMLILWLGARRPPIALLVVSLAIASLPLVVPDPGIGVTLFVATYACLLGGVAVAVFGLEIPARPLWIAAAVAVALVVPRLHAPSAIVFVLQAALLPAALVVLVFGVRGPLISAPPLAYVGRISYSIYLWQEVATWEDQQMDLAGRTVLMVLLFAGAALSYHTVEAFFRGLGRRYSEAVKKKGRARRPFDELDPGPKRQEPRPG